MNREKSRRTPQSYTERSYRQEIAQDDLVISNVCVRQTDLHIQAKADVTRRATELVLQYRLQLERYIKKHPHFASALTPLAMDSLAPPMVQEMLTASLLAGVGPMAAVAGSMACSIGKDLQKEGVGDIIVENGGDIYISRGKECTIGIYAGESPLTYKVGLQIFQERMPCGICTSSGTIGHSLSLGEADSVTVVADSTPLADAAATRLGNEVGDLAGGKKGIESALEVAKTIDGLAGVVVICDDLLGAYGEVKLVKLE